MSEVKTLLVVWQDENSRLFYHIGTLSHYDDHYEFVYTSTQFGKRKLGDAIERGYMIHPAFPKIDKVYRSKTLFPAFDRRIPSSDRSDFHAILTDLGLNESASKMDILQATRGRLASDTYSFEQPLRLEKDGKLHSSFFIHGMRHQHLPDGWASRINENSSLKLIQEPTNDYDPNAVAIYTTGGIKLGYVPNFYSQAIFSLIDNGASPLVRVVYLNEKSHSHWWVKVDFECEVPLEQGIQSVELVSVMQ
ncbi:hypothetical protein DCC39_12590 [Pueribacillus theae]|uniref:HIRAN domain-containing protein n=1 Tax=Pueribacillus theae TaxID=2171751 RepID=A0A2U1JWV0_9BACI|nr:HIRAN domain-containing protein [Pueribacillus theae]PWA09677.1 hypothetical protein DCC39_12590 [Pueribacillus theae]